jgi:23S rRNA U2552 (ribose-2'-O)-methylase RlmE/FtsJ
MDVEEFQSVDTNFNLPYIGKLYVGTEKLEKYKRLKKIYENVKNKRNKASRL